jgi:adenylate kinase
MNIIIMGPVGSGKSTQAELLADELGISLLNVGDLLYFTSKENSSRGKMIKKIMEEGGLVDDEIVLRLVEEHLKQKEHKEGVIIDGFPRSLWQAKNFSFPIDKVVYLKVSDKVNKERLLRRGRDDDKPELIDRRLEIYHQETEPILAYYRQQGLLLEIDGERPVEIIFKDIIAQLGEKND